MDANTFGHLAIRILREGSPIPFYARNGTVDPDNAVSEVAVPEIGHPPGLQDEGLPVHGSGIPGGGMQEGLFFIRGWRFDGEEFASRGVILVSVGYRLNVFGFLTHPEITAENPDAPSNFTLLDQAAAIKWVKRNIANFGGDPGNITVFGQSGGGDAVQFLLVSPQTRGDFQRAIIQSAGTRMLRYPYISRIMSNGDTMEEAYALSARLFEMCGVKTLKEARKLDAAILLRKYNEMKRIMVPVIDGKFVTELPNDAFPGNRLHDVSLMVTATSNDFMAGVAGSPKAWVDAHFGHRAEEYWKLVREARRLRHRRTPKRKAAD